MKIDAIGQAYYNSDELADILYANPDVDLSKFRVLDPAEYNASVELTYSQFKHLTAYQEFTGSVVELDQRNQSTWYMPPEYFALDIAQWVLDQCKTDAELQRVGEELLLFQERNLFDLLRWLKYFVDTMRAKQVVWGVGRGSSVASYVLYLIGVHRINSMYYDLNIDEFLK
jgi:DNA polymerase III alpha subunit